MNAVHIKDGHWKRGFEQALGAMGSLPPEPYYGYLGEDTSEDLLMLFINPGQVAMKPNTINDWTKFAKERYTSWEKDRYLEECGVHDGTTAAKGKKCVCHLSLLSDDGCRWRRMIWKQLRENLRLTFTFMHSMEFSFYHSAKWFDLANYHEWIHSLNTTQLAVNALKELASRRRMKYILGIGQPWLDLFARI